MINHFVFLVEILFGYNINIGGQISIGEIIILIWFLIKFSKLRKMSFYKILGKLYFFLIIAQIFSECFVSNGFNDSLRGILVSVFSLLHITFLLFYIQNSCKCIPYMLIGRGISILLFSETADLNMQDVVGGEEAGFVKMQLAPMVGFSLAGMSIFLKKKMNFFLFMFAGVALIVMGARSGGLFLVVSSIFGYFLTTPRILSKQTLLSYILCIMTIIYVLYVLYVNEVLSGTIASGNNHQILSLSNPYNPFELLVRGRGEFFVGLVAFCDKFFLGHGAWAMDTTRKYWALLLQLHGEVYSGQGTPWMPVHSVFVGWGVYNGIFAFLAGMKIVAKFLKMAFCSFKTSSKSPYVYCLAYAFLFFVWNGLFSPPSHFRLTLPICMAVIYFCYNQTNIYRR